MAARGVHACRRIAIARESESPRLLSACDASYSPACSRMYSAPGHPGQGIHPAWQELLFLLTGVELARLEERVSAMC